ncbi:hypothetical protein [Williamwhitmania taraxaci]|uniref:YD repeat-containing protein n=1 Tax=Williamwhitmania taraxaci TaxID=1640674 RepID=A0A1G6IVX9_9BACT|nr:hypothetical protein [Williamwhitmania taraxaci]SDC10649.1 hypothetical protein SAMN05216323_101744 [Williamwhitmania taraxaci]
MKKIMLLLLCTAMLFTGCKKHEPTEKTILGWWTPYYFMPEKLNGKVKVVKEQNYWAVYENGQIIKGELIAASEKKNIGWTDDFDALFDEQGQILKCDLLNTQGITSGSWLITLDEGIPTIATWQEHDSVTTTVAIKTDKKGNIVETNFYSGTSKELLYRTDWVYAKNNEFIRAIWYDTQGKLTKNNRYTWNSDEQVTEIESYTGADSLVVKFSIAYNKKGFSKKQERIAPNGQALKKVMIKYEYDENLNWIRAVFFEDEKPLAVAERTYEYY